MATAERTRDDEGAAVLMLSRSDARVLTPEEERSLLLELDEQRRGLAAGARAVGVEPIDGGSDVQDYVRALLAGGIPSSDEEAVLLATARSYNATRTKLAMANLRLVAHVARRYRDRGLSHSDLLQEGFCGLLTAIDRYDVSNNTRLASYAVWWIRQALQRAVAAGVYPVRLNPRHLQKLAESSNEEIAPAGKPRKVRSAAADATLKQIHAATRPAVSLDAPIGDDGASSLLDSLCYPPAEDSFSNEREEQLSSLIGQLQPREQMVLQLRFGLNGGPSRSLSQVSDVLEVSKERVRQIQDAALSKLRNFAGRMECCEVG